MSHVDRRLLRLYNRELRYLREMGGEFAREFPKIADRLTLRGDTTDACPDPYVERLIEGSAFLAARVQLKLEAEFPRFTQSILDTVYPHYLAPVPSMAIVALEPDYTEGSLVDGFTIDRNSTLLAQRGPDEQTRCEYRTAHDVILWPLELEAAAYHLQDLDSLQVRLPPGTEAALRLRLRVRCDGGFAAMNLDQLCVHLTGENDLPMRLYEAIFAHGLGVVAQPGIRPVPWNYTLDASHLHRVGFEDEHALLPPTARSFQGYRLLQEYFAFYRRFMFVNITGLASAVKRCDEDTLDLIIPFNEGDDQLERLVDAQSFRLFATPAINLFPKRADRIHLTDRFSEFHVVPDRTRARDFEVFMVTRVTGYGLHREDQREFEPFYAADDLNREARAYYTVNRVPRVLSERERQGRVRRSTYAGSEVYLSLVDGASIPYGQNLRQLGVEALCTNRDLPLKMSVGKGPTDFQIETGAPVASVRCVGWPTTPYASRAEGEAAWRMVSHLSLNYLSLMDSDDQSGAASLRELLRLYADLADPAVSRHVEGVRSIRSTPVTQRAISPGPIAFVRGRQIEVDLAEDNFEGVGAFLFGAVLEHFFAKYVSINSFTRTVVRSEQRGELMRWPARLGRRHLI